MSTLRVTNVQDTSGGNASTTAQLYSGRCIAWVYYEMSDPSSMVNSYNFASLTDQGQGLTRFTFTTAMSNANYCVVSGGFNQGGGDGAWNSVYGGSSTGATNSGQTTTYFNTASYGNNGSLQDQYWAMFAVFGGI